MQTASTPGDPIMNNRRLPWLMLLFVGSGCAALIYEIVWLQFLQLIIGLTTASLGILLGTFMGGMCLGSFLLPRLVGSRHHPLRVYAWLELGIAVCGVSVLFLLPWISTVYSGVSGGGFGSVFSRGAVAAICLLPPTMLMGATLPALARWIDSTREGISWLGFFYGGNILGAVAGSLLAGFYLLRVYDMATATYAAAALNILVAGAAWLLARNAPYASAQENAGTASLQWTRRSWIVLTVIALSGMSALGAEVVWTRLMSLALGGTVYTFSIILAVFLVGLGAGSSAGASLARSVPNPGRALTYCQTGLGLAIAWTAYMVSNSIPYWPINPALSTNPWVTLQLDLLRCLWAVLPGALLWGASFPLALAALSSKGTDTGRLVGSVYAANTVGAIFGALVFSLVIVPKFGSKTAQQFLVGLAALAGVLSLASDPFASTGRATLGGSMQRALLRLSAAAAILVLAAGLMWTISPVPWGLVAYGRYMATWVHRLAPDVIDETNAPPETSKADIFCRYLGEGVNGSVAVTEWSSGTRSFHSAGKVQASTDWQDMRLQRMLGHLSTLSHSKPESVLVVACGAGVTAGTFVLSPSIKRIVICDIEPLVPQRVAPMFAKENYGVVTDPRTHIVADDGRHFLRTTREKFDIITSDPIDPWVKGCAALNTVDYYELCKSRLNPGGVMSLWVPLYESNPTVVKSLVGTFFKAFPNGVLFSNDLDGEGYDAVLLGKVEPLQFDLDALSTRFASPDHERMRESLRETGFNSLTSLFSTYAGRPNDLTAWLQDAQINTDRNLRLQYLAGLWLNSNSGSEVLREIVPFRQFPSEMFAGSESRRKMLRLAIEGLPRMAE